MKITNALFPVVVVLIGLASTSANAALRIVSATYGVYDQNGRLAGPACDARPQMNAACDGKEGCQVYVDPRYLCGDPAPNKAKVLEVVYLCNGKQELLRFPDTAQAALRCLDSAAGGNKPANPTTQGTQQPGSTTAAGGIPGHIWRVTEGDPSWRGVWTRRGDSNVFDVVNTRTSSNEVQRFTVSVEVNGNNVTIKRDAQYYNGTLSSDRKRASGTATWYSPGTSWSAVIE